MQRYEKYKESGVKWIGEIPGHWETRRVRYLCDICTGDKDTVMRDDNGAYPFYVRSPKVERINTYSYDGEAILMAGDGVGAGKVFHYVNGKFDYHQRVYNLHNIRGILGKFFFYFIRDQFHYTLEENNAKSTVDSVRLPWIKSFPVILPPLAEQQGIVAYLDAKTEKIDQYIAGKEKEIERLGELKQVEIANAVTHGLNPNAKMKPSGIAWIGDIPEEWEVSSMRSLFKLSKEKTSEDNQGTLLSLSQYTGVKPKAEVEKTGMFVAESTIGYNFVRKGQFVMNIMLAWNGSYAVSDFDGIISPSYCVFDFIRDCDKKYFDYLLRLKAYSGAFKTMSKGLIDSRLRLYPDYFKTFPVIIPPLSEQQAIVAHIERRLEKIDGLAEALRREIGELKELKQRIVSDAVTGKVKVCET